MSASVGCGLRSSRSTAVSTIPGVQIPHCAPPYSMNACCTACSSSSFATPSIVLISLPSTWATGTRQLLTIRPSTITVQAPHSPSPHPSFVPVSRNSSRNTSSNLAIGKTSSRCDWPLTLNATSLFVILFHQHLRHERDAREGELGGVFDGVQDRGRRAVHRQLADSFGAARAVRVRVLFEVDANRRNVD